MSNRYAPSGSGSAERSEPRDPWGRGVDWDGRWGPATSVGGSVSEPKSVQVPRPDPAELQAAAPSHDDGWSSTGTVSARDQRAARKADERLEQQIENLRPKRAANPRSADAPASRPGERGLPWWAALGVLIVIAAIGGLIDTLGSDSGKGGFNIGIVVASFAGILLVRRAQMFPIVIAPPIVYSLAAVFELYIRSGGLHDKRVVLDAAANYLVYGFPAIAAATAAVLIIAGIRLIARK